MPDVSRQRRCRTYRSRCHLVQPGKGAASYHEVDPPRQQPRDLVERVEQSRIVVPLRHCGVQLLLQLLVHHASMTAQEPQPEQPASKVRLPGTSRNGNLIALLDEARFD